MLKNSNEYNDMNVFASDAISACIQDGYRIDAKESIIDREKDKDCTFKAVLKKDVSGIECKRVITLYDNGNNKNRRCEYRKVDTVGGEQWSEEVRTFSHSFGESYKCCSDNKSDSNSQFNKLNDYIKLNGDVKCTRTQNTKVENTNDHVSVGAKDSLDDIYSKIVDRKKNLKEAICAKDRDYVKEEDEVDDSLVNVVRYIFGL